MDIPDYTATVIDKNGIKQNYYEQSCPIEVARDFRIIQNFLIKSAKEGIISERDKVNLVPEEPK